MRLSRGSHLSGVLRSMGLTSVGTVDGGGRGKETSAVQASSFSPASLLLSESGGDGGRSADTLRSCVCSSYVTPLMMCRITGEDGRQRVVEGCSIAKDTRFCSNERVANLRWCVERRTAGNAPSRLPLGQHPSEAWKSRIMIDRRRCIAHGRQHSPRKNR